MWIDKIHFAIFKDDERLFDVLHDIFEHVRLLFALDEVLYGSYAYLLCHARDKSDQKGAYNYLENEILKAFVLEKVNGYKGSTKKQSQVVDDVSANRWFKRIEQDDLCEENAE